MQLNAEQRRAVEDFSTDLLVMAGAGTGKTRVLTQKYLYLLQTRRCEVPQIVAVTFTNKAAAEMRDRIRKEMKVIYHQSTGPEREYWSRQLELLEVAATITTIHGLCLALLRQHPVEAGIDPQGQVLDEGEEYLFKAKAAKTALSTLLTTDESGFHLSVVLALGANFFLDQLPALYSTLKEAGVEVDKLVPAAPDGGSHQQLAAAKKQLQSALCQLEEQAGAVKLTPRAQALLAELFTQWPSYRGELDKLERLTEEGAQLLADLLAFLPKNLNKQLRPAIDAVHDQVAAVKTALVSREAATQQPVILAFLRLFDQEYSRLKQTAGKLDFTDQLFLVRKMLRAYPAIVQEYRRRFAYFMVDEFQDTNGLQWEIIQLLCGKGHHGGRMFLVGDLKQSIYRFRGAEVEIMTALAASKLDAAGQVLVLTKNYRTKAAVAAVINRLCGAIFTGEAFPYHPLVPAAAAETDQAETGFEILLADEDEPFLLAARIKQLVMEGELLVRDGKTTRPVQYGDVALLFRTKTRLKAFEDAFRAQGIPYQVTAGVGFYARQEIQDQLNLLRLVECPDDALALAGVLRSPFACLSDQVLFWLAHPDGLAKGFYAGENAADYPAEIAIAERKRLARLRRLLAALGQNAHLLTIPEILRTAWTETGYLATVAALPEGERSLANLEKLILRAEDFAAKGYSGLRDFIAFLRHLSTLEVREGEAAVPQGDGNFVQMMTVHAAKGLEFPVVVIPELDREFNLSARTTVAYHKKWGLVHKVKDPSGAWLDTAATAELREEEKRAEISELKRLFYVGLTRARDYLLLSATVKEVKAQTIAEGRSWLDWLELVWPGLTMADEGLLVRDHLPIKLTRSVSVTAGPEPVLDRRSTGAVESAAALELPVTAQKMTTRRLSLTPLLTFQECPRRFFWQHRLGSDPATVPPRDEAPEERVASNYSLLLGEVFHRLIAGPVLSAAEVEPALAGWFHTLPPVERQAAVDQVKLMYQHYLASPFLPATGVQVENELPFVLALQGVIIKGVIDRVLIYPDGRIVVVDFKTNRRLPAPGKIRDRYYFQVYLYALAVRAIYGQLPAEAWIYFVRPNIKLPCPLTEKNLGATEEQILKTVDYITTHDRPEDYPPGADCEFCPFTPWCKEAVSSSQ